MVAKASQTVLTCLFPSPSPTPTHMHTHTYHTLTHTPHSHTPHSHTPHSHTPHTHTHTRTHAHTCTHTHTHAYINTPVYTHANMCIQMYTHMPTHMYTHTHTHTHTKDYQDDLRSQDATLFQESSFHAEVTGQCQPFLDYNHPAYSLYRKVCASILQAFSEFPLWLKPGVRVAGIRPASIPCRSPTSFSVV